jgi:plasmid replication initiation protein
MIRELDNRDLELKKHVGSIHCSNTLSLLQRKISNVLLYHAYDELLIKEEHEISLKNLCSMIGYSSHDYDSIKRALKALISTVLEWNLLADTKAVREEDWNASSILASVGIRGGVCTYSYSNRLKKLLYMPEMYGKINIAVQAKFKSNYGLALYENCIRYQNLPHTRWFALAMFRKLMGVPETKYPIFRDFKRRVLDKSVEEINLYSDIVIQPEIEREGHKVNRIRFKLQPRAISKSNLDLTNYSMSPSNSIVQQLLEFGISQQQAGKIQQDFNPEFIKRKIQLVKESTPFKQGKVQNPAAYLKSALKEDYIKVTKPVKSPVEITTAPNEDDLKKQYFEMLGQQLNTIFESFDTRVQEELLEKFKRYLQAQNNFFVLEKYHQRGLTNRIVKSLFHTFLREQHSELLPPMETFDGFTLKQDN